MIFTETKAIKTSRNLFHSGLFMFRLVASTRGVMGNRGMEIEIAMSVGNGRIGTANLSETDNH